MWPSDTRELVEYQHLLAGLAPEPWRPGPDEPRVGGCWVCFSRGSSGPGDAGDPAWAAAALLEDGRTVTGSVADGAAGAAYVPGMLALRLGPLLERAVRALPRLPDVLLVDGTGRDHPRRAGLALHLGAALDIPTVGVTHRPLLAAGDWPAAERGAHAPLVLDGEAVGAWVRVVAGRRPLAVHAAWRTDVETAVAVVLGAARRVRTPEPLRAARLAARVARAGERG